MAVPHSSTWCIRIGRETSEFVPGLLVCYKGCILVGYRVPGSRHFHFSLPFYTDLGLSTYYYADMANNYYDFT